MRWDDTYKSRHECFKWYDLMDDDDNLLGYVRENLVNHTFIAQINENGGPQKKFDSLKDAKAHILTYYVTQKLEGA